MRLTRVSLALSIFATACAAQQGDPSPTGTLSDGLTITDTDTGVTGNLGETQFTADMVTGDQLEITVTLNGMMLTSLVDYQTGVIELDGFALANGENTQMTDEDRATLGDLEKAFAGLGADEDLPFALAKLRSFVAEYVEFPTTLDMQKLVLSEDTHSYTSLCYAKNSYYPATHDCGSGNDWSNQTTLNDVWMSSTGDLGGPDGVAWYFPSGGSYNCCSGSLSCSTYTCSIPSAGWWVGVEVDHDTRVEYSYGNCFGVCGAGCPGTYQFTVDCVNHDQCVRNGHVTASGYCDGEFSYTLDDWASAPDCGA